MLTDGLRNSLSEAVADLIGLPPTLVIGTGTDRIGSVTGPSRAAIRVRIQPKNMIDKESYVNDIQDTVAIHIKYLNGTGHFAERKRSAEHHIDYLNDIQDIRN